VNIEARSVELPAKDAAEFIAAATPLRTYAD
jgi:hypothetical protein